MREKAKRYCKCETSISIYFELLCVCVFVCIVCMEMIWEDQGLCINRVVYEK